MKKPLPPPQEWLPNLLRAGSLRKSKGVPKTLGRLGNLEVRLARNPREIGRAQKLRYKVFYEEMAAKPNAAAKFFHRDADRFDPICDHVLVLDHEQRKKDKFGRTRPRVIGTYRLLRQDIAEKNGGFYTAGEYDIRPLISRHPGLRFLELGRSCVLAPYRNKRTVELLWHGVWTYILAHRMDVLIGCASLEGTNLEQLKLPLSFLHHFCRAEDEWQARALPKRAVDMNLMPKEEVDRKKALQMLPPLVKGYLRLGAMIGDGAVIDKQFNTTDVLMILPVSKISGRYIDYFGADASKFAKEEKA